MPPASPPLTRERFLAAARESHTAWLAASGLAARSCRTYTQQVNWYLGWLERTPRAAGRLAGPAARRWYTAGPGGLAARKLGGEEAAARQRAADKAATIYHDALASAGAAPASVKLALSGVGSLYRAVGLRAPLVEGRVTTRPYDRPRTLTDSERNRVLSAAARRGTRDHAITALADDAGLRPGEIVAANLGDVSPGADAIGVRSGAYAHRNRVVPITSARARAALAAWLKERDGIPAAEPALFVTGAGRRLTLRTVEHLLGQIGADADVAVSPGTLRNTRSAALADSGVQSDELADRLGHARPESLRPFAPAPAGPWTAATPAGPAQLAVGAGSEQRSLPAGK